MIQRCFALPYYVYCLRLRCLVSFLFYSTINGHTKVSDGIFSLVKALTYAGKLTLGYHALKAENGKQVFWIFCTHSF
ncbi:Uncharacterised protein [Neisseria animalis]|nr:Uncharacterised protein [Neisseria animalis]